MEELEPRIRIKDIPKYVLVYIFWILTAAICLLLMLQVRNTINVVWPALGGNRWVLRPIDRFGLVLMGLAWLSYVIFTEEYYRTSISALKKIRARARQKRDDPDNNAHKSKILRVLKKAGIEILLKRFALTAIIPIALIGATYLIQHLTISALIR